MLRLIATTLIIQLNQQNSLTRKRGSKMVLNMTETDRKMVDGLIKIRPSVKEFGDSLLSSMNESPDEREVYARLRKKVSFNLKKGGEFYGLGKIAELYIQKLQAIHYPHCAYLVGTDPKIRGTTHP